MARPYWFWALHYWACMFRGCALRPPILAAARVRVMTWNVLLLPGGTAKFASEIRAQNPDIVCLQETLGGHDLPGDRTPELIARFPGWHSARAGDVTILSRWPIRAERRYPHPWPSLRRALAVTCQTPDGPLDVIVAHISTSAQGSRYGGRKPRSLRRLIETATLVGQTAQTRHKQLPVVDKALDESQRSGRPYLLAGDFNNPPRGGFHRHLKARLTDAFAQGRLGQRLQLPVEVAGDAHRLHLARTRIARATGLHRGDQGFGSFASGGRHRSELEMNGCNTASCGTTALASSRIESKQF